MLLTPHADWLLSRQLHDATRHQPNTTMITTETTIRLSLTFASKLAISAKVGDVLTVRVLDENPGSFISVRDGRAYKDEATALRFRAKRPKSARMFKLIGKVGRTFRAVEIA